MVDRKNANYGAEEVAFKLIEKHISSLPDQGEEIIKNKRKFLNLIQEFMLSVKEPRIPLDTPFND